MGITSGEFERDMMHAVAVGGGRCFSSRFGASIPESPLSVAQPVFVVRHEPSFPSFGAADVFTSVAAGCFLQKGILRSVVHHTNHSCFIPDLTCMRVRVRGRVARRLPIKGDGMAR